MNPTTPLSLEKLKKGRKARITSIEIGENDDLSQRLMEIGLLEGSTVELVHEAPFGGDPVAIRVRGALIALRRSEAARVQVTMLEEEAIEGKTLEACCHG